MYKLYKEIIKLSYKLQDIHRNYWYNKTFRAWHINTTVKLYYKVKINNFRIVESSVVALTFSYRNFIVKISEMQEQEAESF